MESTTNDISTSMVATLEMDNLSVAGDLLEVGLDTILEEGVLRDIPIIGVLVGGGKIIHNISDMIFTRKLAAFLYGLKDCETSKRKEAIIKWETNARYRTHLGETLVNMIHRCDDSCKAKWLSKLFYELVLLKQQPDVFMRAENVLSSLSVIDVISFLQLPTNKYQSLTLTEGELFANSGLYRLIGEPSHIEGETLILDSGYTYAITEVGKRIYNTLREGIGKKSY